MCSHYRNKSIIKKKKHDERVLLGKTKLDTTTVLISKFSIGSYISHEKFVSVNNMLRECNETKEEIKNHETSVDTLYKYGWYKQKNVWKNGIETIVDKMEYCG